MEPIETTAPRLSAMVETNRVICFNVREPSDIGYVSLEQAVSFSKDIFSEINVSNRIVNIDGISVKSTEVAINTTTELQRIAVCDEFGLRRTSHLSNRENVVYVIVYPTGN